MTANDNRTSPNPKMREATGNESADARRVRRRPSLRGHSEAGGRPRRRLLRRLGGLGTVGPRPARHRHPGKIRCRDGSGRRARGDPDVARHDLAAVCGAGQRRRLAHLRAGRRPQRLGVPSRRRGVPGGARGRAAHRRIGPRLHRRVGRRLRGRHPHRRVPGPLALPRLPHHRHRRHHRRRRRNGAAARARCAGDAQRHRLGRDAGRRAVGVPARRRRFQAAPHRQGRRRRADRGLPGARRLHRRQAHPRGRARHGRRHVERRRSGKTGRPPGHALGAAGNVVQVPRLVPPHPPGGRRAAQGSSRRTACCPPTSPGSPRMCIRARSTCSAR